LVPLNFNCRADYEAFIEEVTSRHNKRIGAKFALKHRQLGFVKESNLPSGKHQGGFDFRANEVVNKTRIYGVADNHDWVNQGSNLLLFGASGVGKTHLASSLGYSLIEDGIRVKFYSATALVQHLKQVKKY
jgi:DNA replication protein DnaC